jgi:hypothetical protein
MRIPEVKEFLIKHYMGEYTRETAVMILGKPGIGKSVAMKEAGQEIARKTGLEFVEYSDQKGRKILESDRDDFFVHNSVPLVMHEPSDITGVPRGENGHREKVKELMNMIQKFREGEEIAQGRVERLLSEMEEGNYVQFKPLLWTYIASVYPGFVVLDDFPDVRRPDLFSAAYKVSLERRAGYQKLHDGQMVVGAGNTPEESSLSQMFPAPLANRFIMLGVTRPTVDEWGRWMNDTYGNDWDRRTLAYLKRQEKEEALLQMPEETEVLENFPTPRTWTKTALELEQIENKEVVKGLLGKEMGRKFGSFMDVDVSVEQLLNDPSKWELQSLDAKHMLCLQLSNWYEERMERAESKMDAAKKAVNRSSDLLKTMMNDSRQYALLVFLSVGKHYLADGLLDALLSSRSVPKEVVNEAIDDRGRIKKMAK